MARLIVDGDDFSEKLKEFSITCKKCGSKKVTFDIDWAAYPSCSWLKLSVICEDCKVDETIYDTYD